LWVILPSLFVLMSVWGIVPANLISVALHEHAENAGSASALLGLFQYGLGGLGAPLVGIGGQRSGLPLAVVIFSLSVCAAGSLGLVARRARGRPLPDSLEILPLET
jgi:DHA1 family bicyclomycin/chloramphenicol resistance-like MFS transporter